MTDVTKHRWRSRSGMNPFKEGEMKVHNATIFRCKRCKTTFYCIQGSSLYTAIRRQGIVTDCQEAIAQRVMES